MVVAWRINAAASTLGLSTSVPTPRYRIAAGQSDAYTSVKHMGIGRFQGATIRLDNSSATDCVLENLLSLNRAEVAPGESGAVRIAGLPLRSILLVECGQP